MSFEKGQDEQVQRRRGSADQERDKAVYRHLLTLTELELNGTPPKPNESSIAKQWGMEDNRIYVRRVLRSVLHSEYYAHEKEQPVPGLTLGKLVNILAALQRYWKGRRSTLPANQVPKILSRADKLKAFRLFFHLSLAEREAIELAVHPGEALLQRLMEDVTDPVKGLDDEDISRLYKIFLRQYQLGSKLKPGSSKKLTSLEEAEAFIRAIVTQLIEQYFEGLEEERRTGKICDYVEKVQREISRIEFQSGIKQAEFFLNKAYDTSFDYLTPTFIQRLTQSVVENEILTDEFPIYLKYFEVERVRPLPLSVLSDTEERGLLNQSLLIPDEDEDGINGLERQFAYRVKVHFYLKLPEDYQPKFPDIALCDQRSGQRRLNFSEEITGIGSPLSHIIAAINRVLLWDIPVLKDYLMIADEVLNNEEVIGGTNQSPVWSHSVARLYKNSDIANAIHVGRPCHEIAETQEIAYGEFCGFDLIEVAAKAALHARLRLIKQIGVNPQQYLKQLCYRVEEHSALEQARSRLRFHPFSLRAMEGELERTIFNRRYRTRKLNFEFAELEPGVCWSGIAIDAHLDIADANLKEGLYKVAKQYLDAVSPFFEETHRDLVGNLPFAKYHLCWFRYYYLSDLDDPDRLFPDRFTAVRMAEVELEKAEECLKNCLKKYENLNELQQSNFHPHFYVLSRIYAHRAKLHIFFSTYTRPLDRWRTLIEPVRLLEKARIYAAQDGDSVHYAQWCAYQSWCYVMVAYLSREHQDIPNEFTRDRCIDWAKRLLENAQNCYAINGKICYQQIKDNGGKTTDHFYPHPAPIADAADATSQTRALPTNKYYEAYGDTLVQVVPLIQESRQSDPQTYEPLSHVVNLDVSLLKKVGKDDANSLYLFGMHSSILLFAMGVLEICQDYADDEALAAAVRTRAVRMLTYCWAIASDGTQRRDRQDIDGLAGDKLVLDRAFAQEGKSGDYLLQGLYPHRLTQFADLGKIFVIVCKLLLIVADEATRTYYRDRQSEEHFDEIQPQFQDVFQLLDELKTNNQFPTPEVVGQQRYNGHLAEHYKNLYGYVHQFVQSLKRRKIKSIALLDIRNKIVTDVFRIIWGESNVAP